MSYILDALNKSERERSRKKTPGLSSLNDHKTPSLGARGFFAILLVVVVLNSAGLYLYFGGKEAESPALIPAPVPVTNKPVVTMPLGEPPEIEITAHIYASDSELRMVKIDGVSRREGEVIGDNHRLVEITEQGLVLEYAGESYALNVVEDWQNVQD